MSIIVLWLIVGRLVTWLLQINGLTGRLFGLTAFTRELRACDLCLGFWVFSALAGLFRINLIDAAYLPVVSEMLSGALASFAVHLAVIGWTSKFGIVDLGSY